MLIPQILFVQMGIYKKALYSSQLVAPHELNPFVLVLHTQGCPSHSGLEILLTLHKWARESTKIEDNVSKSKEKLNIQLFSMRILGICSLCAKMNLSLMLINLSHEAVDIKTF